MGLDQLGLPEAELEKLCTLCRRLRVSQTGLTAKNRARL